MMRARVLLGVALASSVAFAAGALPGAEDMTGGVAIRFEGQVRDAGSGRPIGGAQVFIQGTVLGTLTAADGRYAIETGSDDLVGSTVTLTVRLIGFAETSTSVAVEEPGIVTVDFELEQVALALRDIVTVGVGEDPLARSPVTVERLEAAHMPATAGPVSFMVVSHYGSEFNTESYAHIEENGWKSTDRVPLSTLSIDVDRASYSNVRRFITDGRRPPIDAVRIEEMINYFPYDDPEPSDGHPFSVSTEVARAPWNEDHYLVRIGIRGESVEAEDLPPSNLVFLLDVSGSMRAPNKLPLLKRSLRLLVNELRPADRVAIVVYAGAAGLVLESTSGRRKGRILDAIEGLEAGGSTAGGAGLRLAYRVATENHIDGGNNRVILATDGDFNVGSSSDSEMTRLIEARRDQGTYLTVLGFGMGNLKDSKLEAIADHGNGNYAYIDNLLEARKVLVTEMGGTLLTIAKDVKIQVEFNPQRVQAYRLIGYENRLLAAEDFNDDEKDAGELGAGHTVTALYEVVPVGAPPVPTGSTDPLRYADRDPSDDEPDASIGARARGDELMFVKLRYKRPDGERSRLIERPVEDRVGRASDDLRFAASVAAFGMLLRDSEHSGDYTLADVSRLARGAVGEDRHGYRSEFVRLVEATRDLGLIGDAGEGLSRRR